MTETMTTVVKGMMVLAGILFVIVMTSPELSEGVAEKLESTASLFRRHASAMRVAYGAYRTEWQSWVKEN